MKNGRSRTYLTLAASVLGLLVVGTTGYMLIEGWGFLDAFYMVVITLATVGFREVHPLTSAGMIFTILLIVFGLSILLYVLRLFGEYIVEEKLVDFSLAGRARRLMNQLKNPIIIVGFGRVGKHAAWDLKKVQSEIVVIDKSEAACRAASGEGLVALLGDGGEEEILQRAGVERAKALLVAVGNDSDALLTTLTARGLNPQLLIVARSGDESSGRKLLKVGANHVVTPSQTGGWRMAALVTQSKEQT